MADTDAAEIAAAGYLYNASENPIWLPGRYNHFLSPRRARVVQTAAGPVVQVPASATPLLRIPLFWLAFKNMPLWKTTMFSRWVLAADRSLNTYFHPWEFTNIQGRGLPWLVRRIDGQPLLDKLAAYITWLQRRARLTTYTVLAEHVQAQR
jgi:hypothetical protein